MGGPLAEPGGERGMVAVDDLTVAISRFWQSWKEQRQPLS